MPVDLRLAWLLGIVIFLRAASGLTGLLCYCLLAAYAFRGPREVLRALALSWLATMWNPGLGPDVLGGGTGRFLVIGAAAASSLVRWKAPRTISHPTFWVLGLGFLVVIHSMLFSRVVDVSVLKAISWSMASAASVAAFNTLGAAHRREFLTELYAFLSLTMLISIPFYVRPVGYLRNGTGFQGVLNHPQAFGTAMGLLGAWTLLDLFASPKLRWHQLLVLAGCGFCVIVSEARTAGFAMVLGAFVGAALSLVGSNRPFRLTLPGLANPALVVFLLLGAAVAVLGSKDLGSEYDQYVSKRHDAGSLVEAYERSRGGFVSSMLENIEERPLTGIGFGIPADAHTLVVQRDPFLGLPTGAVVEKGVMPLAVLEELGLPLGGLVLLWFAAMIRRAAQQSAPQLATFATILALNLGESTFFSPGGMGMLYLVFFGWAAAAQPPASSTAVQEDFPHT